MHVLKAKSTKLEDYRCNCTNHFTYIYTGVDPDMVLSEGYRTPLHKLRCFLGSLWRVELKPELKMSVSLKYKTFDQQDRELSIDVDVLVSPKWENPADLYDYLRTAKHNGAKPDQLFR